jgi:hypothetical protein
MILGQQPSGSKAVFEGAPKHRGQTLFTFTSFKPAPTSLGWHQLDSFKNNQK